jgi:hypothetical protein
MLALIFRHLLGVVVVSSPFWGAGLLCAWIRKDRKSHQARKTSGSATALFVSTNNHW